MLASSSLSVKNVCLISDKMEHFLKLKTFHKLALLQILKERCITITVTKKNYKRVTTYCTNSESISFEQVQILAKFCHN